MNGVWVIVQLIFTYIFAIPFIVMYVDKIRTKKNKEESDDFSEAFSCVKGIIISALIFITLSTINMQYREYVKWNEHEVKALQDNETFMISRYSSDSSLYYYYMVKNNDGSYESRKASQDYSSIKYTSETPKVIVYKKEAKSKIVQFFMPIREYVGDYKYVFYVPEGSIEENYNVDLN